MRLTLKQRRDVRTELQWLTSLAQQSTEPLHVSTYIENMLDNLDFMEPPRWQAELARRRERKARR